MVSTEAADQDNKYIIGFTSALRRSPLKLTIKTTERCRDSVLGQGLAGETIRGDPRTDLFQGKKARLMRGLTYTFAAARPQGASRSERQ